MSCRKREVSISWVHVVGLLALVFFSSAFVLAAPQSDGGTTNAPGKADPAAGKPIFERYCSSCHGISGDGGRGPRLNRPYLPHAPDDDGLRSVISNGIPPAMPDAPYLSEQEIANVAAHIRSLAKLPGVLVTGDAERGASLYARSGCSSCHIHNGQGVGFGPELSDVGDRRSASFLKGVLENPASELSDGFLLVTATTLSGKSVTGIRMNEDTFTIQIKDNGGRLYSFRKKHLKQLTRQTGKTPMPSYRFSPSELQDLVAFLASSRRMP